MDINPKESFGNNQTINSISVISTQSELSSICGYSTTELQNNGTCGENVKWEYNEKSKLLTISGSGKMNDYSSGNDPDKVEF